MNSVRLFKAGIMLQTAVLCLSLNVFAQSSQDQGYAIAQKNEESDRGFKDSVVDLEMILQNATGKTSRRQLTISTLENPGLDEGDKSLTLFKSPADVNGTALLSYAKILEPDDQWLYLPALKRVKRISSVNKSGPFVGSEFAFEDFTGQELNKFDYTYLKTEPCGDLMCDVIERIPKYEYSGYSKQFAWIDQTHHQIRKVDFFDRKGDHLKTLEMNNYKLYDNQFWRPQELNMINHVTGKSTQLLYSDYQFVTGLTDKDFDKNILDRVR